MADPVIDFLNTWTGLTLALFAIVGGLYAGYRVVVEMIRRLAKAEAATVVRVEMEKHRSLDDLPRTKVVDEQFVKVGKRLEQGSDIMAALQQHAHASVVLHRITLLILDKEFPGVAEQLRVNNSDIWKEYIEPYRNGKPHAGDGNQGGQPDRIRQRPHR